MTSINWDLGVRLPTIKLGAIEFYNAVCVDDVFGPIVRCFMACADLIQNGSEPIVMSRSAWDALGRAVTR